MNNITLSVKWPAGMPVNKIQMLIVNVNMFVKKSELVEQIWLFDKSAAPFTGIQDVKKQIDSGATGYCIKYKALTN